MTEVVNFKDVKQHWNAETRQWDDPQYVYIGRRNRFYGLPQSKWANPFRVVDFGRDGAINAYHWDISHRITYGQLSLEELRGKTLVCWCSPLACHGDVLARLLNDGEERGNGGNTY